MILTCSGAVLPLILLRQLFCSSVWASRLVWHLAVGLCLGLCSCLCPFVMECHPCSVSWFHPSIAAPRRVAACRAAAQKRGMFCVSSTAQPHSCQSHSRGGCATIVVMSGSQKVCREIIPGCSSRLADVGLVFFLVVVKLPSVYTLSQSCLPVLLVSSRVLLLLEHCARSRAGFRGVYLCTAELRPWTSCSEQ